MSDRTYDPGVATAPEIHRWTPEEYHELVATGALDELRVELIDGYIVDMSPPSPPHDYAIQWLNHEILPMLDTRATLAIEVSLSSLRRDLDVKPRIYAAASIPRYWVIDLDGRRAVEHTDPHDGGYATVETRLDTLAAPELGVSIALPELLAFALR